MRVRKHACAQDVGNAGRRQQWIARNGDQRREPVGDAKLLLDCSEQHQPTIGSHASAIDRGGDFLAFDIWKTEWHQVIFEHGGRKRPIWWKLASQILLLIRCLRYIRRRIHAMR
jgi:hypothetical protein